MLDKKVVADIAQGQEVDFEIPRRYLSFQTDKALLSGACYIKHQFHMGDLPVSKVERKAVREQRMQYNSRLPFSGDRKEPDTLRLFL